MATYVSTDELRKVVSTVRGRISKFRGNKTFNEQNTKASLIVPVLHALGWDTNDSEEVHWEYRTKPKHNPVDFALLLQRTPCLFLEAKALREALRDDKLVVQILTYASVAGTQWIALSNGDEYRLYNAAAPVPADEKLFRTVTISRDPEDAVLATLSLLSKQNLQDKKISRLWESHFVDRQVHAALEGLFSPEEPAKSLVRTIGKALGGKLKDSEVRASLRRARLVVDFPEEPEPAVGASRPASTSKVKATNTAKAKRSSDAAAKTRVSLSAVIAAGLITPPTEVFSNYRGRRVTATINADGSVTFEGTKYPSLSAAGGAARKPLFKGTSKRKVPATNGWTFWEMASKSSGKAAAVDVLRDRLLEKQRGEASRFGAVPR